MVPDINLLPQLEKRTASPKLFYTLIILIVGCILAYLLFLFFTTKSDLARLTAEQQTLNTQLDQLQQELQARQSVNQGSLEQSVTFIQSVSYPVTPLINETKTLLPVHAYLRSYTFGAKTVNIEADFETMTDISKYVERLLTSSFFTDAQINTVSNFHIELGEDKELTPEQKFKEVPRYSVSITATIDFMYLAGGRRS
ncbi:PilN domain-containing protein [Lysinibacillus sp. NPDC097231]|uniref:PilN domain-containing protein n=1 Tax=Lysinibacillus sp. NPDC097231 TaxID=3364142 RepID=UPI00381B6B4E